MLDKLFLCYSFVSSVKILKSGFIFFVFLKLVANNDLLLIRITQNRSIE